MVKEFAKQNGSLESYSRGMRRQVYANVTHRGHAQHMHATRPHTGRKNCMDEEMKSARHGWRKGCVAGTSARGSVLRGIIVGVEVGE